MDIPPPPPLPPQGVLGGDGPMVLPGAPPAGPPPTAWSKFLHQPVGAGQLSSGWRLALSICWLAVFFGVMAVTRTTEFIGKPTTFAAHPPAALAVFCIPLVALTVTWLNSRWALGVDTVAAVALGAAALITRADSPGGSLVLAGIALGALLITFAAVSGRQRAA